MSGQYCVRESSSQRTSGLYKESAWLFSCSPRHSHVSSFLSVKGLRKSTINKLISKQIWSSQHPPAVLRKSIYLNKTLWLDIRFLGTVFDHLFFSMQVNERIRFRTTFTCDLICGLAWLSILSTMCLVQYKKCLQRFKNFQYCTVILFILPF